MKSRAWWLGLLAAAAAGALLAGASCDDDDETGTGGSSSTERRNTGEPCTLNEECIGAMCLTDETFADLAENDATANIPGGYCSSLSCTRNTEDPEKCGTDSYCFDLEPYVDAPIPACLKICSTADDCRDGYECTGAEGSTEYPPLPYKVCLPPDLLCLLEIPNPACPGTGGSGGTGGAGGSTGGAGGSTGGAGGSTGGAGGT